MPTYSWQQKLTPIPTYSWERKPTPMPTYSWQRNPLPTPTYTWTPMPTYTWERNDNSFAAVPATTPAASSAPSVGMQSSAPSAAAPLPTPKPSYSWENNIPTYAYPSFPSSTYSSPKKCSKWYDGELVEFECSYPPDPGLIVGVLIGVIIIIAVVCFCIRSARTTEIARARHTQMQQQVQTQQWVQQLPPEQARPSSSGTTAAAARISQTEAKKRNLLEYFLTHKQTKIIANDDLIGGKQGKKHKPRKFSWLFQVEGEDDGGNNKDNGGWDEETGTGNGGPKGHSGAFGEESHNVSAAFSLGSGSFVSDQVQVTPAHRVAGCCAICLAGYKVNDCIVWSSLTDTPCSHAFHFDCIVDWLASVKKADDYPCPCCRQQFIMIGQRPITVPPVVEEITVPQAEEEITVPPAQEEITVPPAEEEITVPPAEEE